MGKESIKAVAKEVVAEVGKGRIPVVGKIMRKKGYSKSYSESPERIKNKKAYKEETEPVIQMMIKERDRILKEMATRNLGEVEYSKMAGVADTFIKNIELLSGRPTDRNDLQFYDNEQAKLIASRIIGRKQTAGTGRS